MIFPLLTLPYLTRVLSVDVYGSVAYVKSLMSYFQVIVDFGFMLSGTKEIAENVNDENRIGVIVGEITLARLMIALDLFWCIKRNDNHYANLKTYRIIYVYLLFSGCVVHISSGLFL